MAREIKFRAKYFDEWYFGIIVTRKVKDRGRMRNLYILMGLDNENWIPLNEDQYDTIGQYTGLHDKNGNEIYEGDIVKTKYGRPCVIEWLSTICFVGFDLRPEVPISKYKQPDGYDLYNSDNLEVIGNIHDNPELLKEE